MSSPIIFLLYFHFHSFTTRVQKLQMTKSTHSVVTTIAKFLLYIYNRYEFSNISVTRLQRIKSNFFYPSLVAGRTSLVVSMSDCGVRGPRFKSQLGQLSSLQWLLQYAALGMGCTLLQRLSTQPCIP